MKFLTEADHERVSAAIAAAEGNSAGEIIAVAAERSDSYHDVALHYALGIMFLAMAAFAAWPALLTGTYATLFGHWTPEPSQRDLMTLLLGILLLKFLVPLFILRWMPLRHALVPAATRTRRVRRRAVMLFKAAAERRTAGHTGILIYLSLGEHRAEIIGDSAITAVTTPADWAEAMTALLAGVRDDRPADGIVGAVERVGQVLARHFPRDANDRNEIPDKLIEL